MTFNQSSSKSRHVSDRVERPSFAVLALCHIDRAVDALRAVYFKPTLKRFCFWRMRVELPVINIEGLYWSRLSDRKPFTHLQTSMPSRGTTSMTRLSFTGCHQMLWLVACGLLLASHARGQATLVASSKLQACVNEGTVSPLTQQLKLWLGNQSLSLDLYIFHCSKLTY